jgi:hypothetical protein
MFHNSTTLHRFSLQSAYISSENRRVFLFEGIKNGFGSVKEGAKVAGGFAGRWAKRLSWTFGGPIIWKGVKAGYGAGVKTTEAAETGGHIALEAAAGVKDATIVPAVTWVRSAIRDVKMNLIDVPIKSVKTAWETAKGPLRFVNGVRKAIWGTLKNSALMAKNALFLKGQEFVKNTRELVSDVLAPITEPCGPVLAAAGATGGTIALSKLQYLTSYRDSVLQARDGINRVMNARAIGDARAHKIRAERALTKKKKEEEEAKAAEAEKKSEGAGGGGKKKK